MLGVCSTIARVGGISAPWIAVYLPTQVELRTHQTPSLLHPTPIMEDTPRPNHPKNPTPILLQGSLSAAVPLYIFGAASSLAGVVAALGLTESLGSPLPNNFEVTHDPILDCTPVLTTNPI